jgi:hypothetical protein
MKPKYIDHYMIHTVTISVLLFTAIPSFAEDWETIITTKNYDVLVDLDAYNVQDSLPYITFNTAYKATQSYHVNAVQFEYLQKHTTTQFDCVAHTYKNLKTVYYKQNKQVVGRGGSQNKFSAIPPNSTLASLESLVCQVHKMVDGH